MTNKHVFQFGNMELMDDYTIDTCNEGVHVNFDVIEVIEAVLDSAYSNKRFGFIANRVNSYSTNPLAVRRLFTQKNLVAGAIVGGSKYIKNIANLEFEIIGGPPKKHFEDMSSAVKWVEVLVRGDCGDISKDA